ncbi:MAG TPA: CBS domain-containing protein [Patescibacteria group bacterium]|nr:CBS domain-containing protein [Patescibacteria group bacterium]
MLSFIFALLLLSFSLVGVALRKVYYYLPPKELKRQAEGGDKLAVTLWRAVAYDSSLRLLLWLWIGLTAAGGFVVLARIAPWWLGLFGTALVLWLAFAWFPRRVRLSAPEARLARLATPAVVWLLNYLHPVFEHTLAIIVRRYPQDSHTSLYESEDLLELVERQGIQPDNRISKKQLARAQRALTAHQHKVGDILVPRAQVKAVSDNDTIGLVLLDELHDSGQSSFPVTQGKTDKIIGTLYAQDLNLQTEGKVRDYMQNDVRYLHEDDSLAQALQAFYKTKHQLFVVVNSFEEYVGIVTLEHVVQQLAGEVEGGDFDQHADLKAVAAKHEHDNDEAEANDVEPEPNEVSVPEPDDKPADISEPEEEIVSYGFDDEDEEESKQPARKAVEPEASEDKPTKIEAGEPETSEDEPAKDEAAEPADIVDPEDMAALDLPEEDDEVGSHVTFEKPKSKKSKPKAPESDS